MSCLHEKVRNELAALTVFALFPCVINLVEPHGRRFNPHVQMSEISRFQQRLGKLSLRIGISDHSIQRCLKVVTVCYLNTFVTTAWFGDLVKKLDWFVFEAGARLVGKIDEF